MSITLSDTLGNPTSILATSDSESLILDASCPLADEPAQLEDESADIDVITDGLVTK